MAQELSESMPEARPWPLACGVAQEQYDEVLRRLTDGGTLSSLSEWPVDGVLGSPG